MDKALERSREIRVFLSLSRIALMAPPMIGLMAPVGGAFLALEPGVKKGGFLSLFFVVFLP